VGESGEECREQVAENAESSEADAEKVAEPKQAAKRRARKKKKLAELGDRARRREDNAKRRDRREGANDHREGAKHRDRDQTPNAKWAKGSPQGREEQDLFSNIVDFMSLHIAYPNIELYSE